MAEALRVVVLDIAASKTGALSVLRDYHSYVKRKGGSREWFFITGVEGLINESPEHPNIHVIVRSDVKRSKVNRLFFDRFSGTGYLESLKPDVIVSLQNTLPRGAERIKTREGKPVRTIIYLHQPLGFQKIKKFSFFSKYERELAMYQYLISSEIDNSLKRANRIIVQTGWMKDAVCEKDGIAPHKVKILKPDVGDLTKLCKPNITRDPSLFIYPAGAILYKDHQCILDAAEILRNKGLKDFKVIFTEKREDLPWLRIPEGTEENIEFRGRVDRSEIVSLYQQSTLLFPSYIETFGYPLAEARQTGTPVIAADTPFAREILEGYENKRFFGVSDPHELAGLMKESMGKKYSTDRRSFR